MKVVGLIGGIASGKSRAAEAIVARGAVWIDADRIGHAAFDDPEVLDAVRERFGPGVFTPDGRIDRKTLSRLVFAPRPPQTDSAGPSEQNPTEHNPASSNQPRLGETRFDDNRAWLERLLHPRIKELVGLRLTEAERQGFKVAVLDAPLLLEAGWNQACDEIWFIDAPEAVRLERAKARGWTEAEFRAREATQWPLDLKRAHATKIMQNSGSPAQLDEQIAAGWASLVGG